LANFQVKEAQEFKNLYGPEYNAGPAPEREPLSKISDGTCVNSYFFHDKFATVEEVCAPGFFDFMRSTFQSGSKKGVCHFVSAYLGKIEDGLTEVQLQVLAVPSQSEGPVIMAVGRIQEFKPAKAVKAA
jgi:hypothetical protein